MHRVIACVLLPCYLTACTAWEVQEATPQQVLAQEQQSDKLHVTLSDGSWVVLQQPEIRDDSLIGVVEEGRYRGQRLEGGLVTGIHLDEVAQLAVEKKSLRASAMPIVGAAVILGAVGLVLLFGGLSDFDLFEQP